MKPKLLLLTAAVLVSSLTAFGQTNTPPLIGGAGSDFIKFLTTSSNLWVAPHYIYDTGSHHSGAGVFMFYKTTDYAGVGMGLDYLNHAIWMPSGNVQLQVPFTVAGKVQIVPFGRVGITTAISGLGDSNGNARGTFGAGAAVRIKTWLDLAGEYGKTAGFDGHQIRGGVVIRF